MVYKETIVVIGDDFKYDIDSEEFSITEKEKLLGFIFDNLPKSNENAVISMNYLSEYDVSNVTIYKSRI